MGMPASAESGKNDRFDRIERLIGELQTELDSLKRESSALEAKNRPTLTSGEESILGELMTDRQKALARATRTEFRRVAAGYSFNAALPMGMHFLHWFDPWGVKLEGGTIITDHTRRAGINAAALYSINRFSSLGLLETHLYALAGAGYYWRRVQDGIDISRTWYGTPDRRLRGQLGVGTELSFFNFGGVRFVPETGLQVDRYITQFENSPAYPFDAPESSVFLNPFFAFHLSFYFR
jgi:hypothetical protein